MSTLQPQRSEASTQTSATSQDNRSFANLRMELDENVDLLKYIPFNRATFQPQYELAGAAPERLLYGDMMEEKDQLWIYFTLLGGGQNYNNETHGNRMITFYTLNNAQDGGNPLRPSKVQEMALASQPFKQARDGFQVMAIAKYFFIKRGIDKGLQTPISAGTFKDDLLRACKVYKAAFGRQEMAKKAAASKAVAAAGTHRGTTSREPSRAAASRRESSEILREPALLRSPSQTLSITNRRKRIRSPITNANGGQPLLQNLSSPTSSRQTQSAPERLDSQERDTMVDEYIALQAEEEELDREIAQADAERSNVAAQVVGLQARLDGTSERKAMLMEEKVRIKAEKKRLQSSLESDEMLEFGFQAGRKMESKRLRRE